MWHTYHQSQKNQRSSTVYKLFYQTIYRSKKLNLVDKTLQTEELTLTNYEKKGEPLSSNNDLFRYEHLLFNIKNFKRNIIESWNNYSHHKVMTAKPKQTNHRNHELFCQLILNISTSNLINLAVRYCDIFITSTQQLTKQQCIKTFNIGLVREIFFRSH